MLVHACLYWAAAPNCSSYMDAGSTDKAGEDEGGGYLRGRSYPRRLAAWESPPPCCLILEL